MNHFVSLRRWRIRLNVSGTFHEKRPDSPTLREGGPMDRDGPLLMPPSKWFQMTLEFIKRSCADMKERCRNLKKFRAVTIRVSYFCIELVSKRFCQVLGILQRNDSCTMALFKRKVNVFVMAERSRDDELNRTVQAETRQGRA